MHMSSCRQGVTCRWLSLACVLDAGNLDVSYYKIAVSASKPKFFYRALQSFKEEDYPHSDNEISSKVRTTRDDADLILKRSNLRYLYMLTDSYDVFFNQVPLEEIFAR